MAVICMVVSEQERGAFITQLYKLSQQIVQLKSKIVPGKELLTKVGWQCLLYEGRLLHGRLAVLFVWEAGSASCLGALPAGPATPFTLPLQCCVY